MIQVTIMQALLIAGWVGFWKGGLPGYTMLIALQPLCTALACGVILGKVPQAMVIGAAVQLIYMGLIAPGGIQAADPTCATAVAVTIGVTLGITPTQAVVIAVPVGILSNYLVSVKYMLNSIFLHMADGYATRGETKGITLSATVYPLVTGFLCYFIPVGIAVYKGSAVINALILVTPVRVMHALSVVGGALPALGFALTIFVIGRKSLLLYFVVAFFLAISLASLKINTVVFAIFGLTVAFLHVLFTTGSKEVK